MKSSPYQKNKMINSFFILQVLLKRYPFYYCIDCVGTHINKNTVEILCMYKVGRKINLRRDIDQL